MVLKSYVKEANFYLILINLGLLDSVAEKYINPKHIRDIGPLKHSGVLYFDTPYEGGFES